VFSTILTVQNDYFPIQNLPVILSNKKNDFTLKGKPKSNKIQANEKRTEMK